MYQSRWADPAPEAGEADTVTPSPDSQHQPPTQPQETSLPTPITPQDNAASGLSGAAPTFAPSATEAQLEPSAVDTFAPTGPSQSDLFDDVNSFEESMRIRSDDDLFNDDFTPAPQPFEEQVPAQPSPQPAAPSVQQQGRGRGNGAQSRGRGRGRGAQNVRGDHQHQPRGGGRKPNGTEESLQTQTENKAPEDAPTGPRKETVRSVRGERHATGGVRKPKLTEDELAEKMARISVKNASLAAAHARAEADAASFAERESKAKVVAAQRRQEERKDRQQMMGEREKNRLRKLKAMEGREWDAEKREDDFRKGGRADKAGGFAGDQQDYTDGREYLYHEPRSNGRERGGGGGGRGNRNGSAREQAAPKQDDFPALPPASKTQAPAQVESATVDPAPVPGQSWAEEMDSSTGA